MNRRKNVFVVFEGPDGVGKTSLIKRLVPRLMDELPEYALMVTREPSAELKSCLWAADYNDFMQDRADHVQSLLHLANGKPQRRPMIILCDRYYFSTLVYNRAYIERELSLEHVRKKCYLEFPSPDLVFLLLKQMQPKEENFEELRSSYIKLSHVYQRDALIDICETDHDPAENIDFYVHRIKNLIY